MLEVLRVILLVVLTQTAMLCLLLKVLYINVIFCLFIGIIIKNKSELNSQKLSQCSKFLLSYCPVILRSLNHYKYNKQ